MIRHLLSIADLSKAQLLEQIEQALNFIEISDRPIKKVPALRGKTIINLFMEASTRTRASFEIAGKRLSADTINISSSGSSTAKGETLLDTARNLQAMNPDVLVVRHRHSGACQFLARHLERTCIVNAGDGMHEHPTQALLDCVTLLQHFRRQGRKAGIENLRIAIVGDIRHSRVARSNIHAHRLLGNQINLVGPPTLVPYDLSNPECFGSSVNIHHDIRSGLAGCDVVMVLRMQLERMQENFVSSLEEYTNNYFVSTKLIEEVAPQAVVLHPGPINRGVEIESALADGPRSLVLSQVNNGVAVRMSVLFNLAASPAELQELNAL